MRKQPLGARPELKFIFLSMLLISSQLIKNIEPCQDDKQKQGIISVTEDLKFFLYFSAASYSIGSLLSSYDLKKKNLCY